MQVKKLQGGFRQWRPDKKNYAKENKKIPTLNRKKQSRGQRQRHTSIKLKQENEFYQKSAKKKRKPSKKKNSKIVRKIERDTQARYGFITDLGSSTF